MMKIIPIHGNKELKEKWREAKVRIGDMRGLGRSQRFKIANAIGISDRQVAFDSIAPKQGKTELCAQIYINDEDAGWYYTLKDLIDNLKDVRCAELQFIKVQWNKKGTDATRTNIMFPILFTNI